MTAVAFPRFSDLDAVSVNRDLHMHTRQTDGEATVEALLAEAARRGLGEVAFTEHVRRASDWYAGFARTVREARERLATTAYVGVEAKALDSAGTLDATEGILADAELVLGSVHRFPGTRDAPVDPGALAYADAARIEFDLALGLARHAPLHVLAHPGGMCLRHFHAFPHEQMRTLMQTCLDRGIAVEINASYLQDLDGFLDLCREVNPYVSVGSDVHRLSDVGRCRDLLLARGIGR